MKNIDTAVKDYILIEKKAEDFGFEWPDAQMILEQTISECQEIKEAITQDHPSSHVQEEVGDLLQAALAICLFLKFDIQETLEKVNNKFAGRLENLKELALSQGLQNLKDQDLSFKLELWKKAKQKHNN
jgi:uncharacterized protein YabN with tetrapyrrole methylase and pyrophosphatase domain